MNRSINKTDPADAEPGMPVVTPSDIEATAWHTLSVKDALASLQADERGLSTASVERRREMFGPNELPRRQRKGMMAIYLEQFRNPLVYLLVVAALVSAAMAEWIDAAFIFVVIQANAALGTYQQRNAEAGAEALDILVRNLVIVIREGQPRQVDAAELVPGDIARLESGAQVPADLRLLDVSELTVNESLLTGESTPLGKNVDAQIPDAAPLADRANMLYAGTAVLSGRVGGLVVATGANTEVGRIAKALVHDPGPPPPLVISLERFSRVIGIACLVVIGAIGAVQFAQGFPLVTVFLVAVALAVAAIPEGLPVAITVALSIATRRMARRRVIVRGLPAVEGLGACTLIASDKTGTLTCNELTAKRVQLFTDGTPLAMLEIGGTGYLPYGDIKAGEKDPTTEQWSLLTRLADTGVLCNEATLRVVGAEVEHLGDTVDVAFLVLAAKLSIRQTVLQGAVHQIGAIPYEPQKMFGAVFVRNGDPLPGESRTTRRAETESTPVYAHVKGAAEVVISMCDLPGRDAVLTAADRMAADGYRVLAVARGTVDIGMDWEPAIESLRGLEFLGLVGLIDPVRPEVPAAVRQCRGAGVDVRMITGDHPNTALAISRELGIADLAEHVVTGRELADASADQSMFDRLAQGARVFARIEPMQKLSIVQALQRGGDVVAVSGDGVNDAPALATADIGVAMGVGGTDAARGASDLILADDNFASIVAGIEEGRVAYDNVRKLIYLLISTGLGEIVLFLLSIAAGLPLPLFAVQLLWLNLVTNGIQDIALAFEKGEPGVLERPPRRPHERLFDRRMIAQVLTAGLYMGTAAFLFYAWSLERGLDEAAARNQLFLLMVLFENVHALNARSETRSVFRVPFSANPFLIAAILGAQGLHITAMHLPGLSGVLDVQPIGWLDWAVVAGFAVSLLLVMEVFKKTNSRSPADSPSWNGSKRSGV